MTEVLSKPGEMPIAQVRWACRRGMLELDLILERYCQKCFDQASSSERAEFEALLICQDQDLYDWLVKRVASPPEFSNMIAILLA